LSRNHGWKRPGQYLAIAEGQLREIVGMFGDEGPLEVWFDGGTGPSASAIQPVLLDAAPDAVCHSCFPNFTKAGSVRWMGNEEGMMPLPSWVSFELLLRRRAHHFSQRLSAVLTLSDTHGTSMTVFWQGADFGEGSHGGGGHPLGAAFMPPSSDAVLREHYWFWEPNTTSSLKTTKKLVHNYLTSVGRAANLILNVAPDGTGQIPAPDVARYAEMGHAIRCLFSQPVANSSSSEAVILPGTPRGLPMDMETGAITWEVSGPLCPFWRTF
jgi:hypothetical protein